MIQVFVQCIVILHSSLPSAPQQSRPQRVAVVPFVGNHPRGLLSRRPAPAPPSNPDRFERLFRQPDLRRGRSVKPDSQRNTAAVAHCPPRRPLRCSRGRQTIRATTTPMRPGFQPRG